jgi:serine/threonine protein kinase
MKRCDEITKQFKLVDGKYKIEDRVGGGSFGDVFAATDIETGLKYAIKFEKKSQYVYQTLPKEAKVLNIMEGTLGYVKLYKILSESGFNILIMDLQGPNLEKLFKYCESKRD